MKSSVGTSPVTPALAKAGEIAFMVQTPTVSTNPCLKNALAPGGFAEVSRTDLETETGRRSTALEDFDAGYRSAADFDTVLRKSRR
jgi:hypothetical protein